MSAPLPLTVLADGTHIVDPNGWTVAKCYGDYAEEYASLIVAAVNSHAAMLAAAKEALAGHLAMIETLTTEVHFHCQTEAALLAAAKEALVADNTDPQVWADLQAAIADVIPVGIDVGEHLRAAIAEAERAP